MYRRSPSAEKIMLTAQTAVNSFARVSQTDTRRRIELKLEPGEVHFWTSSFSMDLVPTMGEILCEEEREHAARFRFEEHRSLFVFAHSALRTILSYYSGRQPKELSFNRGPWGKPFLVDGGAPANIMFNLAHSGSLVLVVVAADRRVGVDVEQVRPLEDLIRMAEFCFTGEECAFVLSHAPDNRERAFFQCWARKEAYMKAKGKGLSGLSTFQKH